jgi:hypothetical protein
LTGEDCVDAMPAIGCSAIDVDLQPGRGERAQHDAAALLEVVEVGEARPSASAPQRAEDQPAGAAPPG